MGQRLCQGNSLDPRREGFRIGQLRPAGRSMHGLRALDPIFFSWSWKVSMQRLDVWLLVEFAMRWPIASKPGAFRTY